MSSAPAAATAEAADRTAGRKVDVLPGERPQVPSGGIAAGTAPPVTGGGATRTYRGRTVEELIPRIQDELGADAIIVRRREGLTGGIAGFFQRPFVELEAMEGGARFDAYDEEQAVAPPPAPPVPRAARAAERPTTSAPRRTGAPREWQPGPASFDPSEPLRRSAGGGHASEDVTEHLAALARAAPSQRRAHEPAGAVSRTPSFLELKPEDLAVASFSSVLNEAESMAPAESMPAAESTAAAAAAAGSAAARAQPRVGSSRAESFASPVTRGRVREAIRAKLLGLGVSEPFAEELIDGAAIHGLALAPRAGLAQAVQHALSQRIPVAPPLPAAGAAIVLVGPGGAGKTSCCAALLNAYRKSALLPASCATLLRGSDRGDLQMILSPHVMSPIAIDTARAVRTLRKARGAGLLVIDTPPLSAGDRTGIRKLAGLLGVLEPERVVIALPATLSAVAAAQLLGALRPLGAGALAITHADETDQLGVAVEAACAFGLAPEYLLDHSRVGGRRLSRIDPSSVAARLMQ
jgi:flagellar biosynthesis GTPase FlhF